MSEAAALSPSSGKWGLERPIVAAGCVLLAVLLFASQDTLSKILVVDYSPFEIAWVRYGVNCLLLTPFLLRSRGRALRTAMPWTQLGRSFVVIASAIIFMTGLNFLPVADATAINFVAPLLVTALSIPLLGEKVGVRRWTAVVIGFVGMLVIVQPGGSAFQLAAFLPAISASFWAMALIFTRKLSGGRESSLTTITYSTVFPWLGLTVMMPFLWHTPDLRAWLLMGIVGVISVSAQFLMILAYSRRPASALAPLSYAQLIWATMYGYLVFGNVPAPLTWLGAAIVVASGLYVLRRERVVKGER
jgi:drug/metabolite transporter (DMT)-like permease